MEENRENAVRSGGAGWTGARALGVVLLLALACKVGLAQIGPRYVIDARRAAAPGGATATVTTAAAGQVRLAGKGMALVRMLGLDVLVLSADAEDYGADALGDWPAADLLVLTPAAAGRYDGLAPLAALRAMPVVVAEAADGATPMTPMTRPDVTAAPRLYPLRTWEALHLRKGKTQLRVTALPGQPGTPGVAGFMLDAGDRRWSYRVYVSCVALLAEEAAQLARRLPGADLAVLPGHHPPQVLPALQGGGAQAVALTEQGQALRARHR